MTASPISDLNPLFLAAGCKLSVASKDGHRKTVLMDDKFFTGYRKTAINPDEVLVAIHIPFTAKREFFVGYKQSPRREDDIAIVNAGMRVVLDDNDVVTEASLAFGGMAAYTVMALDTMAGLVGRLWNDTLVDDVCKLLEKDLPLPAGTPGGMETYRLTLTTSFFFKFYLSVQQEIQKEEIPQVFRSATDVYRREPSKGIQVFEEVAPGQPEHDSVGRPLHHRAADKQATGEAVYCDDITPYQNELYLALVLSTKAHARILSIDKGNALAVPGVHCYVDYNDIPTSGSNETGILNDEKIFATDKVTCQGQVIGAVVAESQSIAQRAAKLVRVEYEELEPIITIEQAIAAESYHMPSKSLEIGNIESGFQQADHVIEGEVRIGGQEHFYLETNTVIAVPRGEDGEMDVLVSTQNLTEAQKMVAKTMGVSENKIVCRVKRLGGGFGGKETAFKSTLLPVAVAANKLGRPVRCMLDRDEDMVITGTRHPFLSKYKVGCNSDGKITTIEMTHYSNAGNSIDLSSAVMDKALYCMTNAYTIPNIKVTGYMCNTNLPTNTAFRGFGSPQGMFAMETIVAQIAAKFDIDACKIREVNLTQEGDKTHFNMTVNNCTLQRCWDQVIESSQFDRRKEQIKAFNNKNRWKKRGIAIVPTKYGLCFGLLHLNQGGALIHIYTDGSVLITHGGTEMGQGLHTKMIQVASRALGIDVSKIHISETSTNTVPNTSATAASMSSDLYGMAIMNACQTLLERLEPYINENPKGKWEDWVTAAYEDRVGLSTTGFYKSPVTGFNWETKEGEPFLYFSFGVAVSEVEIDCLTGGHTVLRTDVVMDVGTSLNPAIDIGQIEGGFVQGYGLFTLEEQRYSPDGYLYTRGPGFYKIPGFKDIPIEFNVSLLKGASNPKAVYSSKAIGEPPLFLASSIFFAIYDAISSARRDEGLSADFRLDSPATAWRIRMACVDKFTKQFPEAPHGTYKPWFVSV